MATESPVGGSLHSIETAPQHFRASGLLISLRMAVVFYCLTSLVVLAGVVIGIRCLARGPVVGHVFDSKAGPFANWDGQWYEAVAARGYSYREGAYSSVNFFPGYPLAGRAVARASGMKYDVALAIVSNISLLATFVVVYFYLLKPNGQPEPFAPWVLAAMGLAPTAFFFRMAYSESLLLLLTALFLWSLRQRWPLLLIALIVGVATATRPVGVVLIPAFAFHIWQREPRARRCASRLLLLMPLAMWGLAAFIAYLALEFNDPLVFVKSHTSWNRHTGASFAAKLDSLARLEPAWIRFEPSSPGYWALHDQQSNPLLSLYLADPFYFEVAGVLVVLGIFKRWLDGPEALLALGFLAVPFATVAFETNMEAFGRYAVGGLPVFFVAGRLLAGAPRWLAITALAVSGSLMAMYSALFVRWYCIL